MGWWESLFNPQEQFLGFAELSLDHLTPKKYVTWRDRNNQLGSPTVSLNLYIASGVENTRHRFAPAIPLVLLCNVNNY